MKWKLIAILILIIPALVYGYGAPDYEPDGDHPRIWLTADELATLNARQSANDIDVAELLAYCAENVGTTGFDDPQGVIDGTVDFNGGYRFSGYRTTLTSFGLCYQILKDDQPSLALTYAQYAKDVMYEGLYKAWSVGEEDNGLWAVRVGEQFADRSINTTSAAIMGIYGARSKNGYSTRYLVGVPIAYDWIVESGVFTAQEKEDVISMMYRWFDWTRGTRSDHNNGVLIDGIRYHEDTDGDCTGINNCTTQIINNQTGQAFSGSMADNFASAHKAYMLLVPLATYGDHADAPTYLAEMKTVLEDEIKALWLNNPKETSGGDSPEGWNYASSFTRLLEALYMWRVATGDDIFSDFNWPYELAETAIHRSQSTLVDVPLYGDWTAPELWVGKHNEWHLVSIFGVGQRLYPTEDIMKVGQYILNNANFLSSFAQPWQRVLEYQPSFVAISPTAAGLPLAHQALGSGLFMSRSTWTDAADTIHFSMRLDGKLRANHENYDEGHWTLLRGEDVLVGHITQSGDMDKYNTLVFNDWSHQALNPEPVTPAFDRFQTGSGYAYASGDITNAWIRRWKAQAALLMRRSALHIHPNKIVIYDVARSNTSYSSKKILYHQFRSDPDVTEGVASSVNGSSKVFVETIYPVGAVTEDTVGTGEYRTIFTPTVQQEYEQFLTVVEAVGGPDSQTATSLVDGSGVRGALIGSTVAMFTEDMDGGYITGAAYTVDAEEHYVTNLEPDSSVSIKRDGVIVAGSPFPTGPAGVIHFTVNSGSATYTIGEAGEPEPEPGPEPEPEPEPELEPEPVVIPFRLTGTINFNLEGVLSFEKADTESSDD